MLGRALGAVPADESALTLLVSEFEQLHALVYQYLLHRFFDPELAEELTAQTFCNAATSINRLRGDARQIRVWLLRTATNLANTHYRRNRLRASFLRRLAGARPPTSVTEAAPGPSSDQRLARIRSVLLALRPKLQTVVVLRYYSKMSFADIATVVGCREGAVRARLSRAVEEMRTRLKVTSPDRADTLAQAFAPILDSNEEVQLW